MNITQPSLNRHFKYKQKTNQKAYQTTSPIKQRPVYETNSFPEIPQQIHRAPQNIRRAIKLNKHKKMQNKYSHSATNNSMILANKNQDWGDNEGYGYNSYAISNYQATRINNQKQKLRMQVNIKKINSYSETTKKQVNKSDSKCNQQQNGETYADESKKRTRLQQNRIRVSGDGMTYMKKKLSPLKKGLTVEPRGRINSVQQKKHMKITFFNVEKLNLINMYSNFTEKERNYGQYQQIQQKIQMQRLQKQRYDNFNRTSYLAQHPYSTALTSDIFRSGDFYLQELPSPTKSYKNHKEKTLFRSKPFIPPFQKYYYKDFIWKVAFSNGIKLQCPNQYQNKLKIFVGRGNNSCLIKSLFKRRGWWEITEKYSQAHLVWTQIKVYDIYTFQKNYQKDKQLKLIDKLDANKQRASSKNKILQLKKLGSSYQQNKRIMQDADIQIWSQYFNNYKKNQQNLDQGMVKRGRYFKAKDLCKIQLKGLKVHNHLPNNYIIGNKKALFYTMSKYYEMSGQDVFDYLPLTFHIQNGLQDPIYLKFLNSFYERAKKIRALQKQDEPDSPSKQQDKSPAKKSKLKNIWIVKPGEFSNRGNGITVCFGLQDIKKILKRKQRHDNGNLKTYIVQSYLDKPFLYCKRKFDLRHYMLITSINGQLKGYWYKHGYVRTTSYQYTLKQSFTSIHLTNDAVQKNLPDYGKYEKGNKISYDQLQKYLEKQYKGKYDFYKTVYPVMKKIARDAIRASSLSIDPLKMQNNFEIFGMDFMIDSHFKPWLIQINTNPCYEISCPLLGDIIPQMVQNAIKISVDSVIPPPANFPQKRPKFSGNSLENNKFELVYDSSCQENQIKDLFKGQQFSHTDANISEIQKDQDEVFEDDGVQLED